MSQPSKLFPMGKPVLSSDQALSVHSMAAYWREVMDREDRGPLHWETSQLLRVVGFPAVLELVARAVQAELDEQTRPGLRDADWLQAANEVFGPENAKFLHERACSVAGIDPNDGGV